MSSKINMENDWKKYDGLESIKMVHGFSLYLNPGCEYSRKRFIYRVAESNELDVLKDKNLYGFPC